MFGLEPGRGFESPDKQIADDHRMIDQLGLASLVYDWGNGEQGQSLTFRMEHHAWELYGLPQEADAVARATLARTTQRHSHWVVEWPGRDRVLVRRPHLLEVPVLRGWTEPAGKGSSTGVCGTPPRPSVASTSGWNDTRCSSRSTWSGPSWAAKTGSEPSPCCPAADM